MKKLILGFWFITNSFLAFAQQEPDDIALATNEFQISYYEALKQKGIENNDKAIESLQKCLVLEPNNAPVYNELGRNYLKLKKRSQRCSPLYAKASGHWAEWNAP